MTEDRAFSTATKDEIVIVTRNMVLEERARCAAHVSKFLDEDCGFDRSAIAQRYFSDLRTILNRIRSGE